MKQQMFRLSARSRLSLTFFVGLISIGCQSMSSRFRPPLEGVEASIDDDWEPPKVNSRYAQPRAYQRTERGASPAESASIQNRKLNDTPSTSPYFKDKAVAKQIAETEEQELDIDGALAALPPNIQETARRQLAAIQAKSASSPEEREVAKPAATTANKETTNATPSPKVTAKLSDTQADETNNRPSAVRTASAEESASSKDFVTTAVATTSAADESAVVSASATMPTPMPASATTWNASLSQAIAGLEKQLEDGTDKDENLRLSREITLRMLYLSQRRLNDAVRPIEGLDPHEQEYLRHQAQALFEASNPDAMPIRSRRWSLVMNSQRQATNQLAAASNLEVRSLAFCNDVQGYGVMTKFPKYQFQPDQEVLLYCELENVMAEQVKGGYETQLQGTYEILDANGKRVTDQLLPMEKEVCQNHRRDYFIIYHIYMPARIEPGKYQMRVTIEDAKAKKFGQADLDFQIQP